jgi:RecA-family ATPase
MTRATAKQFDDALAAVVIPATVHTERNTEPAIEWDLSGNVTVGEALAREWPECKTGEHGDNSALQLSMRLRDLGISETERLRVMRDNLRCDDPHEERWLERIAHSADVSGENQPGSKSAIADFANDPVELFVAIDAEPDPDYPAPTKAKDLAAKEFPKRVDVVAGLILPNIVQTIDGDGGVGKSTIMMQMSVAIAAGKPIFERETVQRPVWFITDEDEEQDVQSVMMAMATELGVNLADLPLEVSSLLEDDIAIADIDDNGKVKELAFFRYLDKMLAERRGSLVVIDCLADIALMKEAGRLAPNAFFKKVMGRLCKKHGVEIMILAHPSKASMADGSWASGSTAYRTAVRHKLVMKLVDPKNIYGPRTLETLKKNWGKPSKPITLTWQRGIFILDRDDATGAMKYRTVVRKILELIKDGKRVARNNQADCATPNTLATDIIDAEGAKLTTAKDVATYMRKAEAEGVLKYIEGFGKDKAHYERGDKADVFGATEDDFSGDPADTDADASMDCVCGDNAGRVAIRIKLGEIVPRWRTAERPVCYEIAMILPNSYL